MGSGQGGSQLRSLCSVQVRLCRTDRVAPVAHAVGAVRVVAAGNLANPIRRIAGHGGHGRRRHAASQQPEEVPMAALDRITCTAIAPMEFVVGEVGCKVDVSGHAPVLQLHAATPYKVAIAAHPRAVGISQIWQRLAPSWCIELPSLPLPGLRRAATVCFLAHSWSTLQGQGRCSFASWSYPARNPHRRDLRCSISTSSAGEYLRFSSSASWSVRSA
jgi:hypothetical protein